MPQAAFIFLVGALTAFLTDLAGFLAGMVVLLVTQHSDSPSNLQAYQLLKTNADRAARVCSSPVLEPAANSTTVGRGHIFLGDPQAELGFRDAVGLHGFDEGGVENGLYEEALGSTRPTHEVQTGHGRQLAFVLFQELFLLQDPQFATISFDLNELLNNTISTCVHNVNVAKV